MVERCPDKTEVGGSIPPSPTRLRPSPISVRNQQLFAMLREIREGLRLAVAPGIH